MRTSQRLKNQDKTQQAKVEFAKVIENVCGQGFFGTASVTVNVQDGHIQYMRVVVDRMVR